MIHLDGDTYIDTTLITCGEYQLFLDQQQVYGNLFQPDHWQTTSFPKGQGRAPVLGVRSSDALAFCAWLTRRDSSIWQYRLPTLHEQGLIETRKSVITTTQEGSGYWIENGKEFAWIKNAPPPPIDIIDMTQKVFNPHDVNLHLHALGQACGRTRIVDLEHLWDDIDIKGLNNILDTPLSHASILMNARYFDYAKAQRFFRDITNDRYSLYTLTEVLKREVTRILNRSSEHITIGHALDCVNKLVTIFNRVQQLDLWGNESIMSAYTHFLDLLVCLVLLDARIRGVMPAREGILLARERIKR